MPEQGERRGTRAWKRAPPLLFLSRAAAGHAKANPSTFLASCAVTRAAGRGCVRVSSGTGPISGWPAGAQCRVFQHEALLRTRQSHDLLELPPGTPAQCDFGEPTSITDPVNRVTT